MRETAVESHPFRKVREKGWGTGVEEEPGGDARRSTNFR
jgi:hypothetical protein